MSQPSSDRDRILARRKGKGADSGATEKKDEGGFNLLHEIRGWTDALMFAFLLAMFIRVYVFELFMIPTGSMTPTLIGDQARLVNEMDWTGDGNEDIVALAHPAHRIVHVYLRNGEEEFDRVMIVDGLADQVFRRLADPTNKGKGRRDMIMVNKFSYWFSLPERGDIVVFKTPDRGDLGPEFAFQPDKPVYIKRTVGLPGEELTIQPIAGYEHRGVGDEGRVTPAQFLGMESEIVAQPVLIDGEPLTGGVFDLIPYFPPPPLRPSADQQPLHVPISDRGLYLLGDNQLSSSDSRYWGEVPLNHVRGKAILRYWPMRGFGFVD